MNEVVFENVSSELCATITYTALSEVEAKQNKGLIMSKKHILMGKIAQIEDTIKDLRNKRHILWEELGQLEGIN